MAAKDETRLVGEDLRRKLRMEALLVPEVRSLFKRMSQEHRKSVKDTGLPLDARKFEGDWTELLESHYERVQKSFRGTVTSSQKSLLTGYYIKQDAPTDVELEEAVAAAMLLWRQNQAKTQARFITDTSVRNVNDSMDLARSALAEDDMEMSDAAMAAVSSRFLTRDFESRTSSIVMTETQAVAESTKAMEAATLLGIDPEVVAVGGALTVVTATKKWKTVGDTKVRKIHVDANGQIQSIHAPFEVGGELLRFPGDSGLGATPKNTANCRCSALYRI